LSVIHDKLQLIAFQSSWTRFPFWPSKMAFCLKEKWKK